MYSLLFLALLFLFSRGLFEAFLDKSLAYIVSILGFALLYAIFLFRAKAKFRPRLRFILLALLFLVSSFISAFVTVYSGKDYVYLFYLIYPFSICCFLLFAFSFDFPVDLRKLHMVLSSLVVILLASAIAQQLQYLELPGATFTFGHYVRPPSLTGSYLHYPLIMFLLGAIIHSIKNRLDIFSLLAFGGVFFAFSRSGMMLVIFYLIFIFWGWFLLGRLRVAAFDFYFFTITISVLLSIGWPIGLFELILQRMLSSLSSTSPGNDVRIEVWRYGWDIFVSGNIFFGENFGSKTNLMRNLTDLHAGVVESSFLQNLVNFGIIGTLIFYTIFLFLYRYSLSLKVKAFVFAFFCQSFVYQSIEVVPFIFGAFFLVSLVGPKADIFGSVRETLKKTS